jgi:hypothetical protein
MVYQNLKDSFQRLKPGHIAVMLMIPTIVLPMIYFSENMKEPQSQLRASSQAKSPIGVLPNINLQNPLGIPSLPSLSKNPAPQIAPTTIVYNVPQVPNLNQNSNLQSVVNSAMNSFQAKGLPLDKLSISLTNLNASKCPSYASYQDKDPRFPASITKLFWMAALYGQVNQGMLLEESISDKVVRKMIQKSDNEAASDVMDALTNTRSGDRLSDAELAQWESSRTSLNTFFNAAGYQSINISQKNFPIPKLKMMDPQGPDLQIRRSESSPLRNSLTTYDVNRLVYEIHTKQAISPAMSDRMENMMVRDIHPEAWKDEQYNSIAGFLGEKLPLDTYFASKVGWTGSSRQYAAIIKSADGAAHYILVIFGDDKRYADDWEVFPAISRQIFEQMKSQEFSSCQSVS